MIVRTDRWPGGHDAHWGTTDRADGDFALDGDPEALAAARAAVIDLPWAWLRQVHGATVHVVSAERLLDIRGADGDALVTAVPGIVLAVQTADCVPVTFSSAEGVVGVAHAGWRGIAAGVLEATVEAMRALGAGPIRAAVGPCIHAGCYEFGADDLDALVERLGPHVAGRTSDGACALDTVAAVHHVLAAEGVDVAETSASCTACDATAWYSHRARGDAGRMATVVWREPEPMVVAG